ncbi:histidine phosphatase family protein [Marinoscillum sp.]|uniref:histidine phosphatase family protein n=1 Tax=Marinoscillum sp. TaxID=2024838 RepID=UPI003BABCDA6
MKKLLIIAILLVGVTQMYAQQTTFILMRHAEKVADGTKDPGLTEEGTARSMRLKEMLSEQPVAAIFSTPYQRTKLTVTPLAEAKGVSLQVYQPFQEGFLEQLMAAYPGQTVVVSGHSNTIPMLVNKLIGEEKYEQLDESDYNDLYIVTVDQLGEGTDVHINY